jgi:hypothetical protein
LLTSAVAHDVRTCMMRLLMLKNKISVHVSLCLILISQVFLCLILFRANTADDTKQPACVYGLQFPFEYGLLYSKPLAHQSLSARPTKRNETLGVVGRPGAATAGRQFLVPHPQYSSAHRSPPPIPPAPPLAGAALACPNSSSLLSPHQSETLRMGRAIKRKKAKSKKAKVSTYVTLCFLFPQQVPRSTTLLIFLAAER